MWVSWLNRIFFFSSSLAYWSFKNSKHKILKPGLYRWGWSALFIFFLLTSEKVADFLAESQFSTLDCGTWMQLSLSAYVVRRHQSRSCVLETVPKHYTRGDSTFLMWCERNSTHWGILKGVNLSFIYLSFWRHIVSAVSDDKLMTVCSPSRKSSWGCCTERFITAALYCKLFGLLLKFKAVVEYFFVRFVGLALSEQAHMLTFVMFVKHTH